jgi:protein-tyrosine phosphatase
VNIDCCDVGSHNLPLCSIKNHDNSNGPNIVYAEWKSVWSQFAPRHQHSTGTAFDPPRDIRDEYLRQFFEQGTPIEEKHQEPLKPTIPEQGEIEQKHQEPLKPMTPEELEAEAAYAEENYQRYSNPTPEMTRKIFESIDRHFQSKAARGIQVKSGPYCVRGPWPGRIVVAPRPRGGDCLSDAIGHWQQAGIETVVSALTPEEEQELDLTNERTAVEARGLRFLSLPIPDRDVPPSRAAVIAVAATVKHDLSRGKKVLIHCRQGIGRSGMIAACLLIDSGVPVEEALQTLSSKRGLPVPETEEQRRWLERYSEIKDVPNP